MIERALSDERMPMKVDDPAARTLEFINVIFVRD